MYAVRWIADERITELRNDVAKLLKRRDLTSQQFLMVLGAVDWLEHEPNGKGAQISDKLLIEQLKNNELSAEIKTLSLSLINPDNKFLSIEQLRKNLQNDRKPLRIEAARTLATADRCLSPAADYQSCR